MRRLTGLAVVTAAVVVTAVTTGTAGAAPKQPLSHAQLQASHRLLDQRLTGAPAGVASWGEDPATRSVVVDVVRGDAAALARAKASIAGVPGARIAVVDEAPRPLYDLRGGDPFYIGSGRCSVGFSVRDASGAAGFITAGHCGRAGNPAAGYNRVSQGVFRASAFPGDDYARVAVNSNWTPRPTVNRYNGGNLTVTGAATPAVGAPVCRSGSTTGWRCGTVQALNQTVNYREGTVYGLIRTTVCAEPGDSGGSLVAQPVNNRAAALGLTSGGSGNCSSGGTTYFQPVPEVLSVYGLQLVVG